MGDQDSASSLPPSSTALAGNCPNEPVIPASLKFLVTNIKNLLPHPLTTENYPIWRTQILQQFTATGYLSYLTGDNPSPPADQPAAHAAWKLIDSTLISALFSTISPSILPYVITTTSAFEVWSILERRLQSTCRSRVLQLKNKLHNLQMKNSSMQQYLTQVKTRVDSIAASGSKVDPEDIMLYTLNGLPAAYNPFKTFIRNSQTPSDLDSLYSLLCNEEIYINQEHHHNNSTDPSALYATSHNQ
ncbi:hypothetical protein MA16_Dca005505 [Dendrobium catenatum]|uniref:Retrovirus-related Pol polyprotein from transposon TNT 1-94 n=1 Tax=Dendrobium catenatum TaxID=906689 RepID=A0A2I0X3L9_9ASPA|nr:hypothetical protein MA16_Dca005505 [Dendrobium catenatum]